ncbi:MAG: peptidylprolyl isomerase [Deltaproteobacteria bacterium]
MSLDLLRSKESWFTKGVLFLLAITFIFGLGFSLTDFGSVGSAPKGTAAEVNGEEISLLQFYRARDNIYRQFQQQQQGDVPEGALNFLGFTALNQLIELKLLAQKSAELGFRVSDEELSLSITSNPGFQVDGQFIGKEAYRTFIQQSFKESVTEFEEAYREELLAQKAKDFIFETAKVTDEELLNIYRMQNEKADLYFVALSAADFMGSFSPAEQDIKNYYDSYKAELKSPEKRAIRYFAVSFSDMESKITPSEAELRAYYDSYSSEFKDGDAVKLFADVRDEVQKKIIEQRAAQAKAGLIKNLQANIREKSLGELAKANSAGEVKQSPLFAPDDQSPEIPLQARSRAFSLAEGERAFIQTEDGVWAIELSQVIAPAEMSFEDAKPQVIQAIKIAKAKETAQSKAKEVLDRAKASLGLQFAEVESFGGLALDETGYFSRLDGVAKVESDDAKLDAFYLDAEAPVSGKIYPVGDKFYVVSLKDKREISQEEFEQSKEQLRQSEISRRRQTIYLDWVRKLRQEAKTVINETLFALPGAPPQR